MLNIAVEDTGCGIPMDRVENIFEPYNQGFQAGTGLGLPLSKSFVKLMRSTTGLHVSKSVTGGSIFSFTIPCKSAPYKPPVMTPPAASPAAVLPPTAASSKVIAAMRPSVLVADDSKINRTIMIRALSRILVAGTAFSEACTGEEALQMLSARCYDIAFLDTHYGSDPAALMTGLDVTHAWRQIEAAGASSRMEGAARLPIVGCTANAGLHDDSAISLGQDRVRIGFGVNHSPRRQ
jgi:CheY-like chemotaxis protein